MEFGMGVDKSIGMGFDLFNIMFTLIFLLMFGTFIFIFISKLTQWNKNNNSTRLTVLATVVAKRMSVSSHGHSSANDMHHHHSSTTYYATFEVESGDRMELHVDGSEYGMLVEGDYGKLSFQGTRYLGFVRQ